MGCAASVLAAAEGQAVDMAMENGASPYATKQARYGDKMVWWFIIVARGKIHCVIMKDQWAQNGAGMAEFVSLIEPVLKKLCGVGKPFASSGLVRPWPRLLPGEHRPHCRRVSQSSGQIWLLSICRRGRQQAAGIHGWLLAT